MQNLLLNVKSRIFQMRYLCKKFYLIYFLPRKVVYIADLINFIFSVKFYKFEENYNYT